MSRGGAIWESFGDVDAASATADAVGFLGDMRILEPVLAGKRRAAELLGAGPGSRVLDVGCGDGLDTLALASLVAPDGEAVGIDPSALLIEVARTHARERQTSARFEIDDAQALSFASDCFDGVLCDRTLQHLPDPATALGEMARVTRSGGRVVVSECLIDVRAEPGLDASLAELVVRASLAPASGEAWMGLMAPLVFKRAGLALEAVEHVEGTVRDAAGVFVACGLDRDGRPRASTAALDETQIAAFGRLVREHAGARLWAHVRTAVFVGRPA